MRLLIFVVLTCLMSCFAFAGEVREWTDASGEYTVQAELVEFDETHCVLKRESDSHLVYVFNNQLSEADQEFLASEIATEIQNEAPESYRTWTLKDGRTFVAQISEYAKRTISISRSNGKLYVNNSFDEMLFDDMLDWQKYVVLGIASFQGDTELNSKVELERWLFSQRLTEADFNCSGVELKLQDGVRVAAPFHMFSSEDQAFLKPGWEEWLAVNQPETPSESDGSNAEAEALAREMRLYLRARTRLDAQDRALNMQANQVIIQEAWGIPQFKVNLIPKMGARVYPMQVVIGANNSALAGMVAAQRYPYHQVAGIARVNNNNSYGPLGIRR